MFAAGHGRGLCHEGLLIVDDSGAIQISGQAAGVGGDWLAKFWKAVADSKCYEGGTAAYVNTSRAKEQDGQVLINLTP